MLIAIDFDKTMVNGHMHNAMADKQSKILASTGKKGGDAVQAIRDGADEALKTELNQVLPVVADRKPTILTQQAMDESPVMSPARIDMILDMIAKQGGFKNPDYMISFINTAHERGDKIAITSFTRFPEVIAAALDALVEQGLSSEARKSICIIAGYPVNPSTKREDENLGKGQHLELAMQHFGITNNNDVVLMDDDKKNITVAKAEAFQAVHVPETPNPDPTYFDEVNKLIAAEPAAEIDPEKQAEVQKIAGVLNGLSNKNIKLAALENAVAIHYKVFKGLIKGNNEQELENILRRVGQSNLINMTDPNTKLSSLLRLILPQFDGHLINRV